MQVASVLSAQYIW